MELSFERFENGRWYVVFPEWEGDQDDLEMVEGADKMLDALTEDGLYSSLDVDLEEPADGEYFILEMEAHDPDGAFYNIVNCPKFEGIIWLCNVTHEFFGDHPDRIYCRVIS
ncbi:MAG: hypothetical protein K2J82_10735 [Muribaculaceae bacterium]|nr:hypothetical protein [Muribaculaceae bacterium]